MAGKRFPRGHRALVNEGFVYLAVGKCRERECGAAVLWYRTPGGKRIPIDAAKKIPHPWVCSAIERSKGKKRRAGQASHQGDLFPW